MNIEGKRKHSPLTYYIYDEICRHVGKENAVSSNEITAKFGIDQRTLRHFISEIRRSGDFSLVIVGCDSGYYVCSSYEEYKQARRRLFGMAGNILKVAWANERKANKNGQGIINLDDFCADFVKSFGEDDSLKAIDSDDG